MAERTFYYNWQIKRYIIQFMAIFSDMKVMVGYNEDKEPRLISIPIMYSSKDRVVAHIKNENTQNKPIRLPSLSVHLTDISLAPEMRKGVANTRRNTFMRTGGVFPDDIRVAEQRMPVPYKTTFDLTIWASNQEQLMQILEQIYILFDPILQIQTSDEVFDWTRITTVELTNSRMDENVPAGLDRRIIQSTLTFEVPIYLSVPAKVHDKIIKQIYMRVAAVTSLDQSNYDIIGEIDSQNIPYELKFDLDDVKISQEQ